MVSNAKRGPLFATIAVVEAAAMCGRRSAHLLFDALQDAYDIHTERAQMRLAPVKSRSWRDIPRAGAKILIAASAEHKPSGELIGRLDLVQPVGAGRRGFGGRR